MRVIIYCRVSTRKQEDNGASLDTQEASCRAYAEERGWEIVAVYREVHTRVELWERPKLSEAREILRTGGADVLLVHALDRLSARDVHIAVLMDEAERFGTSIDSVTEDIETTPIGRLILQVLAFAAELEREKIMERTARGLAARTEDGMMRPAGRPLYGYQWRPVPAGTPPNLAKKMARAALDINPETSVIVQRIFAAVVAGETMGSVAAGLERDGVLTSTGNTTWYGSSIRAILKNPSYMGLAYTNRKWRNGATASYENATLLPEGTIPALVTRAEWHAAQAALVRNEQRAARNSRYPDAALLRSIAVCGHCGGAMEVQPASGGVLMYKCRRKGCSHRYQNIRVAILDEEIIRRVGEIVSDPAVIIRGVEALRADDPTARDMAALDRTRESVERQRANLIQSLALFDDERARAPVAAEIAALTKRLTGLDDEYAALEKRQAGWREAQSRLDDLVALCQRAAGAWETMTTPERRLAMDALGARVIVYSKGNDPRWVLETRLPLELPDTAKPEVISNKAPSP
jgi:site-specific DNA recombinase